MDRTLTNLAIDRDVVELKRRLKDGEQLPPGILQDVIFSGWGQGENVEVLNILLEAGAAIDGLEGNFKYTPLYTAAMIGSFPDRSLAVTDFLLKKGANPNTRSSNGETPLFKAITTIADKTVQRLIEGGADVHVKNQEGMPLLHQCFLVLSAFLANGNMEEAEAYTKHTIHHVLRANPDFTLTNPNKRTIIQECLFDKTFIQHQYTARLLQALINHGCPTTIKTKLSEELPALSLLALAILLTPQHSFEVIHCLTKVNDILAVELDSPNIFELLFYNPSCGIKILEQYPSLVKGEDIGNTLLHAAVQSEFINLSIVQFLIKQGIDPNKATDSGHTALSLAKECQVDQEIIDLLQHYQK